MERNRCAICGAVISDNNSDGVGFGCMANVVKPAQKDLFYKFKNLDLYIEKAKYVQSIFLSTFKDVKFRSSFRKDFYKSMSETERISKKQLEIMENMIEESTGLIDYSWVKDRISSMTSDLIYSGDPEVKAFYAERISFYKKQYLSNKINHENKED